MAPHTFEISKVIFSGLPGDSSMDLKSEEVKNKSRWHEVV